ncbi:MAG TPA: EAL domain-containing protein, partial [Burkholderiales bacterium]|nr:EAL domain-containing protein [Burkholderiales bacterium]
QGIGRDANATALVAAIIAMAHSLHLNVLAEGVETQQQAAFLLSHGCFAGQGFYYSKATPAEVFVDLLNKQGGQVLKDFGPRSESAISKSAKPI